MEVSLLLNPWLQLYVKGQKAKITLHLLILGACAPLWQMCYNTSAAVASANIALMLECRLNRNKID